LILPFKLKKTYSKILKILKGVKLSTKTFRGFLEIKSYLIKIKVLYLGEMCYYGLLVLKMQFKILTRFLIKGFCVYNFIQAKIGCNQYFEVSR